MFLIYLIQFNVEQLLLLYYMIQKGTIMCEKTMLRTNYVYN